MKVTNRDGVDLQKVIIITICPIQHATEAKQICAEYLNNIEPIEKMLSTNLGKNNVITHCMCERIAWHDEIDKQQQFMKSKSLEWISGDIHTFNNVDISKMSTIIKNDGSIELLNLEVI